LSSKRNMANVELLLGFALLNLTYGVQLLRRFAGD
jgi:hypothetical protein